MRWLPLVLTWIGRLPLVLTWMGRLPLVLTWIGRLRLVVLQVRGALKVQYQGTEIDFTPPFRRVPMSELVKEATGTKQTKMNTYPRIGVHII
jgi:hypothetical protein